DGKARSESVRTGWANRLMRGAGMARAVTLVLIPSLLLSCSSAPQKPEFTKLLAERGMPDSAVVDFLTPSDAMRRATAEMQTKSSPHAKLVALHKYLLT